MRIGIDIRELEKGTMTGTARYLYALLGYAARFEGSNEYVLFGNQKTCLNLQGPRLKVKIIPEIITPVWDQLILPWQIKKEGIDLFYSPYYKVPIFTSARVVITIYDVYPIVDQANQGIRARVIRFWYWLMARNVARIITSSNYSKEKIEKLLKILPSKIRIVYGDVEDNFKPFSKPESLKILKKRYPQVKEFLLFVGSLWPNKNLARLIEAYHQLPEELKNRYQLLICGRRNRFYGGLLRLVKKLGLAERVVFIDFVGDELLPYLYSGAYAFVFPSLHEGFGLPVLEAMACGTPVIASNTTSLPEVVGEAAVLVDPYKVGEIKQAMIKVLTDSALREDLIKQGLERSRHFTPRQTAEQMLRVFNEEDMPQAPESSRCNLCGKANSQFLFNKEGVTIVRCRSCGLVYRSPQLEPEEELKICREAPLAKESNIEFIKKREILLKYLLDELNQHAQKGKLLDLGCQFGYFLQLARKDGWQTFGVDVSKRATTFAKEKLKLNVFTGTLKEANFPDESFDAVTLWEVLNHMSEPMQELKESWRVLKEGGLISFRLQNLDFHLTAHYSYQFFSRIFKIFKIDDIAIFYLYGFSPKIIKRMLKKSGFRDIEVKNSILTKGDLYSSLPHLSSIMVTVLKNIFSFFSTLLFFLSGKKVVLSPSMIVHARK